MTTVPATKGASAVQRPYLSIIIPAYNEEQRIIPSLQRIQEYLGQQSYRWEVVVVDDGSTDGTGHVVEEFAGANSVPLTLIANPHRGKGSAVKTGMLRATGENLFLCDADLSMPIQEVDRFLALAEQGMDVAIGSREAAGAKRYDEPLFRHLGGRVVNVFVQMLAVPGIRDTQCGFKLFRRAVAWDLFTHQTMDGFGFDAEVLYIARKRRYHMTEVGIDWYHVPNSKVSPLSDTLRILRDLLRVRLNDWRGRYKPQPVQVQA